jgi:outer membrane protein assembly factor BamB
MALLSCAWMAAGAVAAAAAAPGDWTQAQGSALHAGVVSVAPEPPYQVAWSALVPAGGPANEFGLSAPIVAGNLVITVAPEQVMGFALETGAPAFTVDRTLGPSVPPALATVGGSTAVVYTEGFGNEPPSAVPTSASPSAPTASPSAPPSSSATPSGSPSPGTATSSSTTSLVAAFDLKTRKPLWPPIPLDQVSRTGVTVQGDMAYVGDDLGTIYAIDLTTGKIRWRGTVGGSPSAPVVVSGDLVIATVPGSGQIRAGMVALKVADGTQAWRYDGDTLGSPISGAAVAGNTAYAIFGDSTIRALNVQDGGLLWKSRLNAVDYRIESPAVTGDAVYALDLLGQLSRFDPSSGHREWDYAMNDPVFRSAPMVAGDHVLAATGRGRFAAIDPASGHLVWQSAVTGSILRSLTPTPDLILAVRGGLQAGLVAYRHDDGGTLVDIVSPTVFNTSTFARNFATAVVPFLVVAILAGRLLSARMGPAFIVEDGEGVPEPVDPWATDDGEQA